MGLNLLASSAYEEAVSKPRSEIAQNSKIARVSFLRRFHLAMAA
jgi:hypothetical protein